MKLEQLQAKIEKDSFLDKTKLSEHAIEIPSLSSKYQQILTGFLHSYKKLEFEESRLKKSLIEYFKMYADDSVYVKKPLHRKPAAGEINDYIKADEEWQQLQAKIEDIKIKIKLVESFITQLNNRNFMIKNAIDWEKFKNGGY